LKIIAILLLTVTCGACLQKEYTRNEFLDDLVVYAGFENRTSLEQWQLYEEGVDLIAPLDNSFLTSTLNKLFDLDYVDIGNLGDNISKDEAKKIFDIYNEYHDRNFINHFEYEYQRDVSELNFPIVDNSLNSAINYDIGTYIKDSEGKYFEIISKDNDIYKLKELSYQDIFEYFDMSFNGELDLSEAEIEFEGRESNYNNYNNFNYRLLATSTYNVAGFNIECSTTKSTLKINASRKKGNLETYFDFSIGGIIPQFKFNYHDGEETISYFKLNFMTAERLGAEIKKEANFYSQFQNMSGEDLWSKIQSSFSKDEVSESFKLCTVKIPLAELPFVYITLDLRLNVYVSGKAEIAIDNKYNVGFEIRNGQMRTINDHHHHIDPYLRASTKATLSLNTGIEGAGVLLCDVGLESGIEAGVKTSLHLFDKEGKVKTNTSAIAYSELNGVAANNGNIAVCADIDASLLLQLKINSSETKLGKLGYSYTLDIIKEKLSLLDNKAHLEKGNLISKCTINDSDFIKEERQTYSPEKITLDSYATVLMYGEKESMPQINLPEGYSYNDLIISSEDEGVAIIKENYILAINQGSTRIKIATHDNKYISYYNVLVSYE